MQNKWILYVILIISSETLCKSQQLNIKETLQEQDSWCWAATTQCVLDFYGKSVSQCEIVNYARTHSSPPQYGTKDCCLKPSEECNEAGYFGVGFENFAGFSLTITDVLNLDEISRLLLNMKPIVISWKYNNIPVRHSVVIYGVINDKVMIMDPLIGFYNLSYHELINNVNYTWTSSYIPLQAPVTVMANESKISIFPNPSYGKLTLSIVLQESQESIVELYNSYGIRVLYNKYNSKHVLQTIADDLTPGMYLIKITGRDFYHTNKIIVQ